MRSLYESILASTGSGKAYLKDYLLKNGWSLTPNGSAIKSEKYHAQTEYLSIRENGSLYYDLRITSKIYRYDINTLEDLELVTEYWRFYNNVYLKGNRNGHAKEALSKAYKALKSGLKLNLVARL